MPSTFLALTNDLLVAFNEAPLTEGEFASARNVQLLNKITRNL